MAKKVLLTLRPPSPMSKLLKALGIGGQKNIFKNTDEEIFVALLESWDFKLVKRMTRKFDAGRQFIKSKPNEDRKIVVYTMSGGPMVVFTRQSGEFVEWI